MFCGNCGIGKFVKRLGLKACGEALDRLSQRFGGETEDRGTIQSAAEEDPGLFWNTVRQVLADRPSQVFEKFF